MENLFGYKINDKIKICGNEIKGKGKVSIVSNCIGQVGVIIGIRQKRKLKEPIRKTKTGLNNPNWVRWEKREEENKFCFKVKLESGNIAFFQKKEIFKSRFI